MTGVSVISEKDAHSLKFEGDMEAFVPVPNHLGMRVTFSDGTVIHWRRNRDHVKPFLLRKGDKLHEFSLNGHDTQVMFGKGLKWAFASNQFYEILNPELSQNIVFRGIVTGDMEQQKELSIR